MVESIETLIDDLRSEGDSIGARIEIMASNLPVGLGEPVFDKLDADIAKGLMSINAVKGVEIGSGFASAFIPGEESSDEMTLEKGKVKFKSNHAGGILGGISSGQNIVARFVVKPTSSILKSKTTITFFSLNAIRSIPKQGRLLPVFGYAIQLKISTFLPSDISTCLDLSRYW